MSTSSAAYYNGYKKQYPLNSKWLIGAGIFSFLGGLSVLIAFCSPYWLESFEETYSTFVRLGLWETCFHNYRHHDYQFDKVFDGCLYIFSEDFEIIKAWLTPAWMIFVQAMVSLALIFSLAALILVSILITRYLLFMENLMLSFCFILNVISGLPMFLAVCVFGAMAFNRSWLLYPTWNYLSWSYGFAAFSVFMFIFSAFCFYKEFKLSVDRRRRMDNLVFNMQRY